MLYILTPGIRDDLLFLQNHPFNTLDVECDTINFFTPNDYQYTYMDKVMYDAAKRIMDKNILSSCSGVHLVARTWLHLADFNSTRFIHRNDGLPSTSMGNWIYNYGILSRDTLRVSSSMATPHILYENNELQYWNTDISKYMSITEIANSTTKETFNLIFPGDKNMFSDDNVRFVIPTSLL